MKTRVKNGILENVELVGSLADYIECTEIMADKLDTYSGALWFRGVEKASHRLVSSLMRSENWRANCHPENENTVYSEFIHKARPLGTLSPLSGSRWYWYVVAQHYGLPTRLLDWSQGALVALHFAIWGDSPTSPTVWVLDPFRMNMESAGREAVFFSDEVTSDDEDLAIQNRYIYASTELPHYPIAISPSFVDERIRAQQGTFTVSGKLKHGLEDLAKKSKDIFLARIRLKRSCVEHLKDQLIQMGVGPFDVYPDLGGLSQTIKFRHEL